MIIALDYDKTYTEDPFLWNLFIDAAYNLGHSVVICTMRKREESEEVLQRLGSKVSEIYFTNRRAKGIALKDMGVVPDIWIDDNPFWIYNNSL